MLPPLDENLARLYYSTMYLSSRLVVGDAGQHSQPSLCFRQVCMSGLPFCDACDDQGVVLCVRAEGRRHRQTHDRCARPKLLTPYIGCQPAPHCLSAACRSCYLLLHSFQLTFTSILDPSRYRHAPCALCSLDRQSSLTARPNIVYRHSSPPQSQHQQHTKSKRYDISII